MCGSFRCKANTRVALRRSIAKTILFSTVFGAIFPYWWRKMRGLLPLKEYCFLLGGTERLDVRVKCVYDVDDRQEHKIRCGFHQKVQFLHCTGSWLLSSALYKWVGVCVLGQTRSKIFPVVLKNCSGTRARVFVRDPSEPSPSPSLFQAAASYSII